MEFRCDWKLRIRAYSSKYYRQLRHLSRKWVKHRIVRVLQSHSYNLWILHRVKKNNFNYRCNCNIKLNSFPPEKWITLFHYGFISFPFMFRLIDLENLLWRFCIISTSHMFDLFLFFFSEKEKHQFQMRTSC